MTYKPTAEDFADLPATPVYKPSAEDFEDEATGFGGIIQDFNAAAKNAIPQALGILSEIPGQIGATASQIYEHPIAGTARAAGMYGSGALEGWKGAYNLPLILSEYLSRKKLPIFGEGFPFLDSPETFGEKVGKLKIGDTGLEKAIFGEEQKGDVIPKFIGMVSRGSPFGKIARGASLAKKAAAGAALAGSQEQNPLVGALLGTVPEAATKGVGKAVKKGVRAYEAPKILKDIEEQAQKAKEKYDLSEEELKAFKEALHEEYGKNTPSSLRRDIKTSKEEAEALKPYTEQPSEESYLQRALPGATGEQLVVEPAKAEAQSLSEIKNYLGEKLEHGKRFGMKGHAEQSEIENKLGSQYDTIENQLKQERTLVPRTENLTDIENSIRSSLGGGLKEAEIEQYVQKVLKQIAPTEGTEEVTADKLLRQYREMRDLAHNTLREANLTQDAGSKGRLRDLADKYFKNADDLNSLLKKHMGTERYKALQALNQKYSTQVGPFRQHPLRRALKKGVVKGDILDKLLSEEPGVVHFRENVVKQDPELMRLALGQRYAKNPEKLLNANETEQQLIERLPSLQGMLERLNQAKAAKPIAARRQAALQEEATRAKKAFEEIFEKEKQRQEAVAQYKKLTADIAAKEKSLTELQKKAKNKDLNKEELNQLEEKAKKLRDEIASNKKRLRKIGNAILKVAGIKQLTQLF